MSILYQRARNSGSCPPSILLEECSGYDHIDGFDVEVNKVIDTNGFYLQPRADVSNDFKIMLEKIDNNLDSALGNMDMVLKKKILDYRRCIVLAIVGGTSTDSSSLDSIIVEGYLNVVRKWLEDILIAPSGSVDMLLHLLKCISSLPVTTAAVKESGMGKLVGTITKHSICKETLNEPVIKERVSFLKDAWNASVKAKKLVESSNEGTKREAPETSSPPSASAKRLKTEIETKKTSSFTNLLQKISGSPNGTASMDSNLPNSKTSNVVNLSATSHAASVTIKDNGARSASTQANVTKEKQVKKAGKRVKWADHFGGQLTLSKEVESDVIEKPLLPESSVSWSDRKRRDRMREKELLAKAKGSKLLDDEDLTFPTPIKPTKPWIPPMLMLDRVDIVQPQLSSQESMFQENRMSSIAPTHYASDFDVPLSPDPLSDVEQALDMTSQASAVITPIPFFAPQLTNPIVTTEPFVENVVETPAITLPKTPAPPDGKASFELIQSLKLPFYLVGQPVEVIQTLAGNPGLLSTLLDSTGTYDQEKLMKLVQTLSSNGAIPPPPPVSSYQPAPTSTYGAPYSSSVYSDNANLQLQQSRTSSRKSDDGNLHVSGYGPGVTESDLVAAFSPYVRVDEVVLKGAFAFVNTSDPLNAQRAREALTGTLLNGMPIRINNATRKARDNANAFAAPPSAPVQSFAQQTRQSPYAPPLPVMNPPSMPGATHPAFGTIHPNVDSVRDDRGNPPTKNLFVAGYGHNTNEQMLRDLFSQYSVVTGVVIKGNFAFVNTSDRHGAVVAREYLGGTMFNGGVLRINFAKETGRLGTSFDLTYGLNTGPNATRIPGPIPTRPSNVGYYGAN